ncbi:palmitoyl-protein thioesterase 1-like [Neltuma alba]|uniref:palmitoyl-protein thioesterase 1-like n=1 Tax=Neltuma alba TaxID=207710 RepID=UPI0010A2BC3E|nr:palmitoyl-protein thioesterase 1-like [Prosopis alba]
MALRSLSLLFVFSVAAFSIPFSHSIPFIVLHGINSECSRPEVQKTVEKLTNFSGVEGHCIEAGNGVSDSWLMPMHKQVEIVCQKVKELNILREGYNIVGLSQGNIIARGVIEFCDGGPPVKNYISLAGPHAGVASVPKCGSGALCIIVDQLIKSAVYSDFVQEHLAPSNYLKIPDAIHDYLDKCSFLPVLNNEYPSTRNSTYKERLSSLENLVLIMFENDTVLIPKETSWFGYYPDGRFEPVLSPNQTKLYSEDWIGLRSLDEGRKVNFVSVRGEHLQISDKDMQKYVARYLNGNASTKSGNVKTVVSRKLGS